MNVFIVYAHHEPASFNGAMLTIARDTLAEAGHAVMVSDLYAMGFDPVSDRRNFVTVKDPAVLNQQAEEAYANEHGGFADELKAEHAKLAWCDLLVLQFPLWWLGMPAILKGWVDKVFSIGHAYGGGRWFDHGRLAGKRAMCVVSTGGLEPVFSDAGVYGSIETVLYPVHRGILGFCGFTVLSPFMAYGPARLSEAQRRNILADYRERLLNLDNAALIGTPKMEDYDGFILKSTTVKPA